MIRINQFINFINCLDINHSSTLSLYFKSYVVCFLIVLISYLMYFISYIISHNLPPSLIFSQSHISYLISLSISLIIYHPSSSSRYVSQPNIGSEDIGRWDFSWSLTFISHLLSIISHFISSLSSSHIF